MTAAAIAAMAAMAVADNTTTASMTAATAGIRNIVVVTAAVVAAKTVKSVCDCRSYARSTLINSMANINKRIGNDMNGRRNITVVSACYASPQIAPY